MSGSVENVGSVSSGAGHDSSNDGLTNARTIPRLGKDQTANCGIYDAGFYVIFLFVFFFIVAFVFWHHYQGEFEGFIYR